MNTNNIQYIIWREHMFTVNAEKQGVVSTEDTKHWRRQLASIVAKGLRKEISKKK